MSHVIARKTFELLCKTVNTTSPGSSTAEMDGILSKREKEILQLTNKGYGAMQLGKILQINMLIARRHIANIYLKLHEPLKHKFYILAHKRKWFS